MRLLTSVVVPSLMAIAGLVLGLPSAGAQSDAVAGEATVEGAVAATGIGPVRPPAQYVTLKDRRLMLVSGQRAVVTREPGPVAVIDEEPPAPLFSARDPGEPPFTGAIWVPGHWTHCADGFVWVDGRHIAPQPGHVFVPPRWVVFRGHHLFFSGFFVPHGVFVLSFFNTFHFSGDPNHNARTATRDRGPYWPIGASGRIVGVPSSKGRGPYWPLGLGPPTVLRTRGGTTVRLPPNQTRR